MVDFVAKGGAILVNPPSGWPAEMVKVFGPGAYAFVFTDEMGSIEGRRASLELRDTLLIMSAGPASRYCFLFRVPTKEVTLTDQVITTGLGGLNIAGCRVSYASESDKTPVVGKGKPGLNPGCGPDLPSRKKNWGAWEVNNAGRWPPNVLFVHGPECKQRGVKRVRTTSNSHGSQAGTDKERVTQANIYSPYTNMSGATHVDAEGLETVPSWDCDASCPVKILDTQTGDRPSTLTGRADPKRLHKNPGDNHGSSLFGGGNSAVYADSGGGSRFYPQFANDDELFAWMQNMLQTPEDSQ